MRLVTLDSREVGGRPAVCLPSDEILDLTAASANLGTSQWRPQSVVSVLAQGDEGTSHVARLIAEIDAASESERQRWRAVGRLLPGAGTALMTPIRRPGVLLMVRRDAGRVLNAYLKNPNAAVGPDARIGMPANRDEPLSGLAMPGLVLGRPLYAANAEQAAKAISAVTLVADLGLSAWSHADPSDRQFPGACVIGPCIATLDEWPDRVIPGPLVTVNAHAIGSRLPDLPVRDAAGVLAQLSASYAFRPGDIVALSSGGGQFRLGRGDRASLALDSSLALRFTISG
ncbi:MAG: fumarylacetoacetate hydrolase family protein [Gammaproteobacteria bacterium]|nr:fumarylacetoacetate hydrolase family protein [Gammaproteobacteria bacterium]